MGRTIALLMIVALSESVGGSDFTGSSSNPGVYNLCLRKDACTGKGIYEDSSGPREMPMGSPNRRTCGQDTITALRQAQCPTGVTRFLRIAYRQDAEQCSTCNSWMCFRRDNVVCMSMSIPRKLMVLRGGAGYDSRKGQGSNSTSNNHRENGVRKEHNFGKGSNIHGSNKQGNSGGLNKRRESAEQKIQKYNRKYGIVEHRPVSLEVIASSRRLDTGEELMQARDRKQALEKEISEIKQAIAENAAKRPARRMESDELRELHKRLRFLMQERGETKRKVWEGELKRRYNQEQRKRISEGRRPYMVPDITKKKYYDKFQWSNGKTPESNARKVLEAAPQHRHDSEKKSQPAKTAGEISY